MSIREYKKIVKTNGEYARLSTRIKKELKEDMREALICPVYNSKTKDIMAISVSVWTTNEIADKKIKKILSLKDVS